MWFLLWFWQFYDSSFLHILSIPFILKNLATKQRHPCSLFDTRIYVHYRRGTCKNCTYLCYFNHEWRTFWACLPYRAINFISALVHVLFTKSCTFYTFLLLTSFCLYMMSLLWNRKVLSKNLHRLCFISIGTPNFCLEIMVKIESHLC